MDKLWKIIKLIIQNWGDFLEERVKWSPHLESELMLCGWREWQLYPLGKPLTQRALDRDVDFGGMSTLLQVSLPVVRNLNVLIYISHWHKLVKESIVNTLSYSWDLRTGYNCNLESTNLICHNTRISDKEKDFKIRHPDTIRIQMAGCLTQAVKWM